MRTKPIVSIVAVLLLSAGLAKAAHMWEDPSGWWSGHFAAGGEAPKYSAQEVSLDLFGSYINPEGKFTDLFDTNIRRGTWGGGAGLNYFFLRNLGLGADFNISSKSDDSNLVDQVLGDVTFRIPLGNSGLAPYAIGSGGRAFSPRYDWVYGGGVGLEMRFNPTTGVFSDARFLWAHDSTAENRLLIRAGFKLVF
jgi:hypothetical protein